MKRTRVAQARQKVWAWFETNTGTAHECSMATGIPMNTIHAAICVMRSHYLPQTANVVRDRKPPADDESGFRELPQNIVELALQSRIPLEQAWHA